MAVATRAAEISPPPEKTAGGRGHRLAGLASWCRTHWVACLVGGSLAAHGAGLALVGLRARPAVEPPSPEVSLGSFDVQPAASSAGGLRGAGFHLAIRLAHPEDRQARAKLAAAQYRLRQGIEELLRQAQASDFDDPTLADLKRQLEQRINETLSGRTAAEVIITELSVRRGDAPVQLGAAR